MPNTMMFVTKMAAPLPSRTAALLLTSPVRMRTSSTIADPVLSMVIAASSTQVAHLPKRVRRDMTHGFIASNATIRRASRTSSGHRGTTV